MIERVCCQMISFIYTIIEKRKHKQEAKLLAWRRSHIPYCIKDSNIKCEDIVPIGEEEYDRIVATLEEKVKAEIGEEPRSKLFAWREVVDSMKNRVRDAYYIKNRPCRKCGAENTIFLCFRSSDESWHELYGREGYMLICPDCLTILGFVHYMLN